MRYYNEAKTERIIRRKAMLTTFTVFFLLTSAVFFVSSKTARDMLPDEVKEWFKETPAKEEIKKIKPKKKKNRA